MGGDERIANGGAPNDLDEVGHDAVSRLNALFEDVKAFRTGEEVREFLEFVARFPGLAPINALLVYIQKPGSRLVASVSQWRNRHKRRVKFNARPLIVLLPNGPIGLVFDISDTEPLDPENCPDVAEFAAEPFKTAGKAPNATLETLCRNLPGQGILLAPAEMGSVRGGCIGLMRERHFQRVDEQCVASPYAIKINADLAGGEMLAVLAHELAHLFCGHLGSGGLGPRRDWRIPKRKDLDGNDKRAIHQIKEFEAESVAWLVCERLGIQTNSARYLNLHKGEDGFPKINIEAMIKAAGRIEKLCQEDCPSYRPLSLDFDKMPPEKRREWRLEFSAFFGDG